MFGIETTVLDLQPWTKYLRQTNVKNRTTGKVQFLFFRGFLLVLTKF